MKILLRLLEEDLNFGLIFGPNIIIMPLPMTHSLSESSGQKINYETGPFTKLPALVL
jgi:hypothetical protein